jgi:hypothetical protein
MKCSTTDPAKISLCGHLHSTCQAALNACLILPSPSQAKEGALLFGDSVVRSLHAEKVLTGHSGCVNRMAWSQVDGWGEGGGAVCMYQTRGVHEALNVIVAAMMAGCD